ncbi:hypothetical protein Y032_0003g1156 [Ancylostoma ceylanicum]|uniref:Uncharacterized protein n=1 Tax=Ancylostoma ceylanicum TaxID=53326 RepID=A0A016VWE2_9BILA|nr:hypothetical protein Y032_0003g1156 [Ancylostoma ceylanicum]
MRKKGRGQPTLIGALGPPVMPISLNSNGINPIAHDIFVLSAVQVKQVGVEGCSIAPITVAWLRPFFPHDDNTP